MGLARFAAKVLLPAALAFGTYTAAVAGWTYYATQDVVDGALHQAATQYRTALSRGAITDTMVAEMRSHVALSVGRDGLPVEDVFISVHATRISATVMYHYPIITHRGLNILVVPMSVQRSVVAI